MHELSLAKELVRLVDMQCDEHGYRHVLCIHLQLDAYSCAAPEALSFAFASLRAGRLAEARLDIHQAESPGYCSICGYRTMLDQAYAACARCGGIMLPEKAGEMRTGEIRVTELEVI
ncbi:MAG: hydrogenase maturation nickel metallochaperone HypA [Mariprofundaceae bacterium]|nr:hydrogenase maturation nickel metallochaperone HypA [Mariprofundaceae bacterium]